MAGRLMLCLRKQKRLFPKSFVGGTGALIFWLSIVSLVMIGFFRHQCSGASYLLPLVMVPTSVMGMFSGVFLWVFVGFLWDNDIKDFMKFMAGFSVVVTFILEFVSFGFAMWKLGDPDCSNPFYGYSIGMPLTQGILFILIFVVYGVHRCREPKTRPID